MDRRWIYLNGDSIRGHLFFFCKQTNTTNKHNKLGVFVNTPSQDRAMIVMMSWSRYSSICLFVSSSSSSIINLWRKLHRSAGSDPLRRSKAGRWNCPCGERVIVLRHVHGRRAGRLRQSLCTCAQSLWWSISGRALAGRLQRLKIPNVANDHSLHRFAL